MEELHELVADQHSGLVLDPVTDTVEFERAHEPRQTGAHLVDRQRIEFSKPIGFAPDEKRGLRDLRAFERSGQIEIRLGGAIIVQAAMEAGALELDQVAAGLNKDGFRTPEGAAWTTERLAAELRTLAE